MSEKTGWFPPEIKPVHIGVYETVNCEIYGSERALSCAVAGKVTPFKRFWNGKKWLLREDGSPSAYQRRIWRGLTEPSAEDCNDDR